MRRSGSVDGRVVGVAQTLRPPFTRPLTRHPTRHATQPSTGPDPYAHGRYAAMHDFDFCISNEEPIFDAADMMRVGKDVFVQVRVIGLGWPALCSVRYQG